MHLCHIRHSSRLEFYSPLISQNPLSYIEVKCEAGTYYCTHSECPHVSNNRTRKTEQLNCQKNWFLSAIPDRECSESF